MFVTGEYNHGRRTRSTTCTPNGIGRQLRLNLVELQVAPIRSAVHIGRPDFMEILLHKKTLDDFPHLAEAAAIMLDDLIWWAKTLRAGR